MRTIKVTIKMVSETYRYTIIKLLNTTKLNTTSVLLNGDHHMNRQFFAVKWESSHERPLHNFSFIASNYLLFTPSFVENYCKCKIIYLSCTFQSGSQPLFHLQLIVTASQCSFHTSPPPLLECDSEYFN
jgi:hypothetical protein